MNVWVGVTYGEGLFVAVAFDQTPISTGNVMTSPDGINWTIRSGASASGWNNVCYGNGVFVAVSLTTTSTSNTMTSGKINTPITPTNNIYNGGMIINGGLVVTGKIANTKTTVTVAGAATTFAIASNVAVVTGDAGGNTIATITGGVSGQVLILIFIDNKVTITDDASKTANTINLSAAFTSAVNTTLTLVYDGTSWYEMARSVNG
jgi:hypothetical protein